MKRLGNFKTTEQILDALGLEVRKGPVEYLLPILGIFSAGILVGMGTGMLIAPRSGRDMRNQIGQRMRRAPRWAGGRREVEVQGMSASSSQA